MSAILIDGAEALQSVDMDSRQVDTMAHGEENHHHVHLDTVVVQRLDLAIREENFLDRNNERLKELLQDSRDVLKILIARVAERKCLAVDTGGESGSGASKVVNLLQEHLRTGGLEDAYLLERHLDERMGSE
jgi:hypothetical protein